MSSLPGPLRLEPVFLPKVWAAPGFPEPFQQILQPPQGTGEVWLASDRHQITPVAQGEHQGLGLDQVVTRWPEYILGPDADSGFPLLIKLLNVGDWLSVQVHPNDQQARDLEGEPWGKSEAWYMLATKAGAEMILGLNPDTGAEAVQQAVERGALPQLLARVPVQAGQAYTLTAGTVHAAGPGMFFFEVQQASDVTYRFYDWERPEDDGQLRPLHLKQALAVLKLTGPGQPEMSRQISPPPFEQTLLIEDPHFRLMECRLLGDHPFPAQRRPSVLFVLQGGGALCFDGGEHQTCHLEAGQSWLLPAGLAPARLQAAAGGIMYLKSIAAGA